jgi:Domain of unknown function (DUF4331)
MKTSTKIWALGLVTLLAGYGCSQTDEEDTTQDEGNTEDQFILGHGSVDQAAIVEATTMMLTAPIALPPLDGNLDPYNQADPFNIGQGPYKSVFAKNLAKYDNEDGKVDWTQAQIGTWSSRMGSANYLVVDTSKPCQYDNPHTYLEIEKAQLTNKEHTTCGGRMPNEDAMDVTLNFLIRGPAASAEGEGSIGDGVEQATKKATGAFPYLAEMN